MTFTSDAPTAPAASVPCETTDRGVGEPPRGNIRDVADAGTFLPRHLGTTDHDAAAMLALLGYSSMGSFIDDVVPESIRLRRPLELSGAAGAEPRAEHEVLEDLRGIAGLNVVTRSCIGAGYYGTITPAPILRNVFENPGWYTPYTPYQAEISQGRLEALLNFQTMVSDLTGLEVSNASLLDEGTAAAEAMTMAVNIAFRAPKDQPDLRPVFFAASDCHPQTLAVLRTRAEPLGIDLVVGRPEELDVSAHAGLCGVLVQYPTTDGRIECYEELARRAKGAGAMVVCATDLLALTLLRPPGEWGADIAVGSAQRFGVPMGGGGPHAAFIATHKEHIRRLPGRIVGVSRDSGGNPALRLTLQTREQHIKRDRATSNICTAQVLLAVMASMYGVYHGPAGLRRIAGRVRGLTCGLRAGLIGLGHETQDASLVFDTLRVSPRGRDAERVMSAARERGINLREYGDGTVGVSLDETSDEGLVRDVLACFGGTGDEDVGSLIAEGLGSGADLGWAARTTDYMTHPVFRSHQSETQLARYITKLQERDLGLTHSMIPLGSCTMKLNAASEMLPVSWREFSAMHPHAPAEQQAGYAELARTLSAWLAELTGYAAISLQPNAGSQGEYAGLLAIRGYHLANGEPRRRVCLVPESAHGTNPASAVMAGMRVVSVKNARDGAIDIADLRAKAEKHGAELAALMVTYPSTCGVFDQNIRDICALVHEHGGQVYMDGANMNAQVGLCRPGDIGADVCHLNLHKTFCIPHGGGGPGMGPIGVAEHLAAYLPSSPLGSGEGGVGAVSAAALGSPSILPISWMYIAMMGARGLSKASEHAILAANYMAARLKDHYPVLFTGKNGRVAHEFVIDCRPFKKSAGVEIDDVAKRLIDYGFHAPTMSWPVPGTLMIEPTESEPLETIDAFCDAMIAIRGEIREIEEGRAEREGNVLKHAPHTAEVVSADEWGRAYPRSLGAYPDSRTRERKFWPVVGRVDNPYGDRNIMCSCPTVEELAG